MMADSLPVGTVLAVGDPAPPTNPEKAVSAVIWGAIPAVLALLATWLESAPETLPSVDPQIWVVASLVLTVLSPILAAYGAYRKANTLTQPVTVGGPNPAAGPVL
jgi:CDP-diglyceride synthetase